MQRTHRVILDITPTWWWKADKPTIARTIGIVLTAERVLEVRASRQSLLVEVPSIDVLLRVEALRDEIETMLEATK